VALGLATSWSTYAAPAASQPRTLATNSSNGVLSPRTISLRSDDTEARREARRCVGRSHRSAQRHPWLLRSIRPTRAVSGTLAWVIASPAVGGGRPRGGSPGRGRRWTA